MALRSNGILLLFVASTTVSNAEVLITGATGRTGSLVYGLLKKQGIAVRGLVRNLTKAKELLGCVKCDSSEGIFLGDVTKPDTLTEPVKGATALVIASSSNCIDHAPPSQCQYALGSYPVDIDWYGAKYQITSFAAATVEIGLGPVVLISTMGTTTPDSVLDKMGNGHAMFYKLNGESFLMSSGLPFSIIRPCGLIDAAPANNTLDVGHDDIIDGHGHGKITRSDVARVTVAALQNPEAAKNLRFDLCSHSGTPTSDADLLKLLHAAQYPWSKETRMPRLLV